MKYFVILLLFSPIILLAQDHSKAVTDSIKTYYIEPIEVKAERLSYSSTLNSHSKIKIAQINTSSKLQVSDVLSSVPGLYVKDYGGMGGIKTISLRGCGSNQTAVSINGMNINSSANGSLDFSNMPTSLFSELQVMRGGLSSYSGSGSLGGTVDLKLNANTEQSYGGAISYGSFNTFSANANFSDSLFNTINRIAISYNKSDGDMEIETLQFGKKIKVRRTNAKFDNIAVSYFNRFSKGNFLLNTFILGSHSKRGVPGAVIQGVLENTNANLTDDKLTAILSSDYLFNPNNSLKISGLFSIGESIYSDSLNLHYNMPLETTYNDSRYNFKAEYNNKIYLDKRQSFTNTIMFDSRFDILSGTMLETNSNENVDRLSNAVFFGSVYNHNLKYTNFKTNCGIRLENINDDFYYSPSIGLNLDLPSYLHSSINVTYSYNYRFPTFNELYYLNYGNIDLEPEFAHSYNLSYNFEPWNFLNISTSGFMINTIDKIIAIPKSPVTWSVVNMGEVLSTGFELGAGGKFQYKGIWDYSLAYTYQNVTDETINSPSKGKQLVYTPQELISASLDYDNSKHWFGGTSIQYVSHRYYQADNTYESLMDSYYVTDIYVGYKIEKDYGKFELVFSAQSPLGRDYQVIHNYPMPGDKIFLSVKYHK
jgi:outer membrane cobalamin receptor